MSTFHRYMLQSSEKVIEALNIGMMEMINQKRNTYEPEYLLLGLLQQPGSVVLELFNKLNRDEANLKQTIMDGLSETITESDEVEIKNIDAIKVKITSEMERVFDVARQIAADFEDRYISTGTLFLAFFSDAVPGIRDLLVQVGLAEIECRQALKDIRGSRRIVDKNAESRQTALEMFTTNLTRMARDDELDPVVGREAEINRLIQILSRRKKNNPVLIGAPGVGKTVIVEGLATKIARAEVPEILASKQVLTLDMTEVVAGAKFKGEFEERLKRIKDEIIKSKGSIILFIDEVHTIAAGGQGEGVSASNILKPALARGQLQCIGATTLEEYKRSIERDKALERRFQIVQVQEPTVDETINILHGLKDRYEKHHEVIYSGDALKAAATLSHRYLSNRFLPDKAIDLMDEAGSQKHLDIIYIPPEIRALKREKDHLFSIKNDAFYNQRYEEVARFQQQISTLQEKLETENRRWKASRDRMDNMVGEEDIARILAQWTSIPVSRLTRSEKERLMAMEENIHRRLVGQNEAVKAVSNAIRRSRAGLKNQKRPIGAFLFLGPTGVGKTELAKSLAEFLLDDDSRLIRLDMSEYQERHTVSRIVGSPPGYVGYGEGGQLTELVRRNPYSVILLDEIEKAHPDVFNILLQIFDDGHITDAQGLKVDFKNTIIIGTSNIGGELLQKNIHSIGFQDVDSPGQYRQTRRDIFGRLKKVFKPEFLNRIDDIIIFHRLNEDHVRRIVDLELEKLRDLLAERDIHLEVDNHVRAFLAEVGFSESYGARPLQREIATRIEDHLSQMIISGQVSQRDRVRVSIHADSDDLDFQVENKASRQREGVIAPPGV